MSLLIPNSTQVPDIFFDYLLALIPPAEYKCLMYINRRTYGFNKESDRIAISQFVHGLVGKDGKRLDYGTGLGKSTVIEVLKRLKASGLITVTKKGRGQSGNEYRLNLDVDILKVVEKISKSKKEDTKFIKERFKQGKLF